MDKFSYQIYYRLTMSSERIQSRISRLWGQAKEAADRSDWDVARQFAEDILAIDPSNDDAQTYIAYERQFKIGRLLARALTAAESGDWEASRQFAEEILALDPYNIDAQAYISSALQHSIERFLNQAKAKADENEFEASMRFAKMALSVDPDNAIAQSYLDNAVLGKVGLILDKVEKAADLRDWEEVQRLTKEILSVDPENDDAKIYSNAACKMLGTGGLEGEEPRATQEILREQIGTIVWSAIRDELGYDIPWISEQEDVSDDLPTRRLGWEVANAVAVGISEYVDRNFDVIGDSDELFQLIYNDVEFEVEGWDAITAEVTNSDYFSPWHKALEDIVETAIPNIEKGFVDSLEAVEIQVNKMLETIHAASGHFTYKWIDDAVNAIVEAGLEQVERLVQELLQYESDDIDVDEAGTDARTEVASDVMREVGWFISDAQNTLIPKLENNIDDVSYDLLTALESMGPISKNTTGPDPSDTSWGDDILSLILDTSS